MSLTSRLLRVCGVAAVLPALAVAQPVPRAFTGATLIDGTGRTPVTNATLLVRDGRIVAAGPPRG